MIYDAIYKVDDQKIISDNVDGETILMNLDSGAFFSLDSVGAEIWGHLKNSQPIPRIIAALEAKFEIDAGSLEKSVLNFVGQLNREGLIAEGRKDSMEEPVAPAPQKSRLPFSHPRLNMHLDLGLMVVADYTPRLVRKR